MGKSTAIGTRHTSDVIRWLQPRGFPDAELRNLAGSKDRGDIVGCPGIAWECKGGRAAESAGDGQVANWLAETDVERINAHADVGVLVLKRAGYGRERYGECWAVVTLGTWLRLTGCAYDPLAAPPLSAPVRVHLRTVVWLLRAAGYGAPLDAAAGALGGTL